MINRRHIEWLESRAISLKTATAMGLCSVATSANGPAVEDPAGDVLAFRFFQNGELVNEKYRHPGKRFSQMTGGLQTLYNVDVLHAEELTSGRHPLVITEGEMDALSFIEAGYKFVVSIPSGAAQPRKENGVIVPVPEGTADIDVENDKKFQFIYQNLDALMRIKRLVIATDNDEPGRVTAQELVRRLGAARSAYVTWPEGCKDANDVLQAHGRDAVIALVLDAKPYPLDGVYLADEIPAGPEIVPVSTGFPMLDPYLKVFAPSFMVVTGRAGHGKSTFTTQLATYLAMSQGWKIGVASFEMVHDYVLRSIATTYHDKAHFTFSENMKRESDRFIQKHFCFIIPNPDSESVNDVDWLLRKAADAVVRHGIRVLLIDPWNEIEHSPDRRESTTEYTNKAIMKIKRFARDFGVLVIVVAHPTKSGAMKNLEEMSLYDISDSAAFQNKADFGLVVGRSGDSLNDMESTIVITKVRYQPDTGSLGSVRMRFDSAAYIFDRTKMLPNEDVDSDV